MPFYITVLADIYMHRKLKVYEINYVLGISVESIYTCIHSRVLKCI